MATSRAELEAALKSGHTVRVRGKPDTVRRVKDLPPELTPTEAVPNPPKVEGVIVRTPGGHLTREGMELAIREGGSVLFPPAGDTPIDNLDDLPTEEEVERWHESAYEDATRRIDDQITLLMAQKNQMAARPPRQQPQQRQQERTPQPPPMPPAEEVPTAQPVEESFDDRQRRLAAESAAEVEQEEQGRRRKR